MLLPFTTNSFQTDPNYNDFSHHWKTITDRRNSYLKTLLNVKITSGHLLSEECDHLGEVDWSWGLSNLRRRQFMAILLSAERLGSVWTKIWKRTVSKMLMKKTHHVVGLAIADWPSNSLQHHLSKMSFHCHFNNSFFCYKTVLANIVNGRGTIQLKVLLESITRMSHYF